MKKIKLSHNAQMWLCAFVCIVVACCGSYAMINSGSSAATTNYAIVSSDDSIKDKIIEKQKKMIELQDSIIAQTMDHLWFEHDCELGICDSYELDSLNNLGRELEELYK